MDHYDYKRPRSTRSLLRQLPDETVGLNNNGIPYIPHLCFIPSTILAFIHLTTYGRMRKTQMCLKRVSDHCSGSQSCYIFSNGRSRLKNKKNPPAKTNINAWVLSLQSYLCICIKQILIRTNHIQIHFSKLFFIFKFILFFLFT